ncbi:MAG TPA: response regulator [Segetibacter sp.]|jgi:CheY-like chemotaxis protein
MKHCEILIIDDDKDDIEILSEAFIDSGVESIHSVASVREAFKYLEAVYPDCIPKLIITDFYLPITTGAEFLQQMKLMDKYKDVHVILVSSVRSDSEVERFKALGALDYLAKPVSYGAYLEATAKMKSSIGL